MIEFESIKWKNFLSYGEVWTEVPLSGHTATLVVGDNGAGKSTLIDALCYSLYGRAFRDISTPQLINSVNSNHMEVECTFKTAKRTYTVKRGLKPRFFEVWQDGKLLNQDASARDYQEILEKQILKINHKSFKQIVVLGSSSFVPFMQLHSKDRKEVIEDLLDIGIFSTMGLLLKDRASENKEALRKIDDDRNVIEQRIQLMHEHIEQLESQKADDIKKKQSEIKHVNLEIETLKDDVKKLEQDVSVFEKQKEDEGKVNKEIKQGEKILDQLLSKQHRHSDVIEFFHNKDECPTCQQEIDGDFKTTKIKTEEAAVEKLDKGIVELQELLEDKTKRLEEINVVQQGINKVQHQIIDKQSLLNSKTMLVNELEKQVVDVKDNESLIQTEREKIDDEQLKNDSLYEERSETIREKSTIDLATRLLKDNGIKSKIIKQYVPVINKLINKYLASMDFFVQFELDENFNETIKSRYRDEFSYASFSEGEKMRIDLSLLFTWRAIAKLKNSASTNLLIMDEVFDSSLDMTGTDEFMKIVMDIVSDTNVFIISHKTDQLVDQFKNIMRFEKHKNFSRMIE